MKRRYLIPLAATAAVLIPAGSAAAHTPTVTDNCQGLNITLTNYEGDTPNNRVTVTIDGTTLTFDFGFSLTKSFTWSQTAAHNWTVNVDANRLSGNPTMWDRTFTGSEQPCQTTSTTSIPSTTSTTTPPSTTTIPPTTTSGPATSSTLSPTTTTATPTTTTSPPPAPTTSIADTTSTSVEVGLPPVPPTTDPPVTVASRLPETGATDSNLLTLITVLLLSVGAVAVGVARRRT